MDHRNRAKIAVFPQCLMDRLTGRSMSLFDWIAQAGTLRADGLELHPLFLERTDKPYLRQVKEAAARQSLQLPFMRTSPDLTRSDSAFFDDEMRRTKEMIDALAVLGPSDFRSCRLLIPASRPGGAADELADRAARAIRELLPYAERSNVCLTVETEAHDARLSALLSDLIRRHFSPSLGIGFAPAHVSAAGEDPLPLLDTVKNRLFAVRTDGGSREAFRDGEDGGRLFNALQQARYRGWLTVGDASGGLDEMASSVRLLREKVGVYLS